MKVVELEPKIIQKKPKKEVEEMIEKLKKEHNKMVKGKFEFIDAQGGWIDFTYRFFPGEPILTISLTHGEICELPMGIVKHLNNTVKKVRKMNPEISESSTVRGVPATYEIQSRLRFTPLEYL